MNNPGRDMEPRRSIENVKPTPLVAKPSAIPSRLLLILITSVVLLYGVIYPNLHVLIASLQRDGAWSIANYREVLTQGIVIEAIIASVALSLFTVIFCALIGIPLAFLFERYTFPARGLFATLAALPLVMPPLVGTVAFIFLCGESGILAHKPTGAHDARHLVARAAWAGSRGWCRRRPRSPSSRSG